MSRLANVLAAAIAVSAAGGLLPVTAGAQQPPPAQQAPPPACDAMDRQFDFWVGVWDVYRTGTDQRIAGSVIESVAQGCAITEHWMPGDRSGGVSISAYDRGAGNWRQMWVGQRGGWVEFRGGVVDGAMVITAQQERPDSQGVMRGVLTRMTYTPNPDGSVRQQVHGSSDGGVTWNASFDATYRRRSSAPGA